MSKAANRRAMSRVRKVQSILGLPRASTRFRGPLHTAWRPAMLMAQGNRCPYCGNGLYEYSRDHVVPKVRSGTEGGNLVLAHPDCNNRKNDRLPHPCELVYLAAVNLRLGLQR